MNFEGFLVMFAKAISDEEQYPQHLLLEFVQDKCDLLQSFLLQVANCPCIDYFISARRCICISKNWLAIDELPIVSPDCECVSPHLASISFTLKD